MTYSVKEMFYTLQGEGFHSGRPAVFCRFTGCNLWSGREQDRESAICSFCDTDFIGTNGQNGGKFKTPHALATQIRAFWPDDSKGFVVFTGGEPGLQLDDALIDAMHLLNIECAVESNGTVPLPNALDWVCISPKSTSEIIIKECDELKLVFPQEGAHPERFDDIKSSYRYLSPKNDWTQATLFPAQHPATKACIDYCLAHPIWSLSLQSHKIINID